MIFYKRIVNRIKIILFKDKLIYLIFEREGITYHSVGYFKIRGGQIEVFHNYKEGVVLDSILININDILNVKKAESIESL